MTDFFADAVDVVRQEGARVTPRRSTTDTHYIEAHRAHLAICGDTSGRHSANPSCPTCAGLLRDFDDSEEGP